jgi:hypothetical protein
MNEKDFDHNLIQIPSVTSEDSLSINED